MTNYLIETVNRETNEVEYYNYRTRSFTNDLSRATRYYSKESLQLKYDLVWLKNRQDISVVRDDTDIGTYLSTYDKPNWAVNIANILTLFPLIIKNVKKYHP